MSSEPTDVFSLLRKQGIYLRAGAPPDGPRGGRATRGCDTGVIASYASLMAATQPVAEYADLAARLGAVADRVSDWSAPSPCEGWTAADVLDHLINTQRDFMARQNLDLGQRPAATGARLWQAHTAAMRDALADPAVARRGFRSFFGPSTIGETLSRFYGFDMVVHRWDIATAAGIETVFSPDEVELIKSSVVVFGARIYSEGVCKKGVVSPPGAGEQDRLLATLGRLAPA